MCAHPGNGKYRFVSAKCHVWSFFFSVLFPSVFFMALICVLGQMPHSIVECPCHQLLMRATCCATLQEMNLLCCGDNQSFWESQIWLMLSCERMPTNAWKKHQELHACLIWICPNMFLRCTSKHIQQGWKHRSNTLQFSSHGLCFGMKFRQKSQCYRCTMVAIWGNNFHDENGRMFWQCLICKLIDTLEHNNDHLVSRVCLWRWYQHIASTERLAEWINGLEHVKGV